jgi:MarR family transcriptional regulator, transcriptional regulator for hemolysin
MSLTAKSKPEAKAAPAKAAAARRKAGSADAAAPSGPPAAEPIGRAISSSAKVLSRAFERELAAAGGSQPVWLVLLALKQQRWRTQQDIAGRVGIEGPTLTHHLDGLEKAGLIERSRDPDDRRAVRVELTDAGDELFHRLAGAAIGFDQRLRAGLSDEELDGFRRVLTRLRENVAPD